MIAANKRLLKATLTEGVLNIQSNLIDLYATNLNSLATQAALVAGFAFTACISEAISNIDDGFIPRFANNPNNHLEKILPAVYYLLFTACVIFSFFTLSQCTLVVMFGPSKALKGDTSETVKEAADNMRHQMFFILKIAFVSVTTLFLGCLCWCFVHTPIEVAVPVGLLYAGGYYMILKYGSSTYGMFRLEDDITKDIDSDAKYKKSAFKRMSMKASDGSGGGSRAMSGDGDDDSVISDARTAQALQDVSRLKYKGLLWKRRPLEKGGTFHKVFAVIDKGNLDIYATQEAYATHQNPMNDTPYKLFHYMLETDPRKFERTATSMRAVMKKKMFGDSDFEMNDILKGNQGLKEASENCKFALLPKVQTELVSQITLEFIAPTTDYDEWIRWLQIVLLAFDDEGKPTVEQSVRKGVTDLYTAVRTANV